MNTNETVAWINREMKNKIQVEAEILEDKQIRGIYGIFVVDESHPEGFCAYVGKAISIYKRMFCGNMAHLRNLRKGTLHIPVINDAMSKEDSIIKIKVLEKVDFGYENFNKDMQHLASRENYYIDKYQELDQCLEQCPIGANNFIKQWEKQKDAIC